MKSSLVDSKSQEQNAVRGRVYEHYSHESIL